MQNMHGRRDLGKLAFILSWIGRLKREKQCKDTSLSVPIAQK
jgi:hypothetical protein